MAKANELTHDFQLLSDAAFDLSQEWFRDQHGNDVFEHEGISFGLVSQIEIFHIVMREVEATSTGSNRLLTRDGIITAAKNRHWEWKLKEAISRTAGFVTRPDRPSANPRSLFIYDVWNTGSIESLKLIQSRLCREIPTASISFEPRVWRLVRSIDPGLHLLYPVGFDGRESNASRKLTRYWQTQFGRHRGCLRERLQDMFGNRVESLLKRFDRFVPAFYTQLAADCQRGQWLLKQMQPDSIVMAADCHKWSRLITLLAKHKGIRTLVVQHGVPVARHAYVPVVADRMAVWGRSSVERFSRWGVPVSKLVITGQPRFDHIPALRKERANLLKTSARPQLVVAASPLTAVLDTAFITVVSSALRQFEHPCEIVLKLHPGNSRERFYREKLERQHARWTIIRYCDTHRLLAGATAVITTQSSIGIEALALGTPLIIVDLPGIPHAVPYRESNAAIMVSTSGQLASAIQQILQGGASILEMRDAGTRLAEDSLYRLDGEATSRVVSLIADKP